MQATEGMVGESKRHHNKRCFYQRRKQMKGKGEQSQDDLILFLEKLQYILNYKFFKRYFHWY